MKAKDFLNATMYGGGGSSPSGTIEITENGEVDVSTYAVASVNVPNPSTGVINISENGTYDVSQKANAVVDVPPVEPIDNGINIYDYDGRVLKTYATWSDFQEAGLPTPPDHSNDEVPLTFDGWTTYVEGPSEIGALYHPTDDKTHIIVEVTDEEFRKMAVNCQNSTASESTGTIDWGDNTTSELNYDAPTTHVYSAVGRYHIKITHTNYNLNQCNGTDYKAIAFITRNDISSWTNSDGFPVDHSAVIYIALASQVNLGFRAFHWMKGLRAVVMPAGTRILPGSLFAYSGITHVNFPVLEATTDGLFSACFSLRSCCFCVGSHFAFNGKAFVYCYSLERVVTNYLSAWYEYGYRQCVKLRCVRLLGNLKEIVANAFNGCYSLKEIIAPDKTLKIGANAFESCYSLQTVEVAGFSSIANNAFLNSAPKLIIRTQTEPGTLNADLSNISYIYAPQEFINNAQSATNWTNYTSKMRALEDYTVDGTTSGALDPTKI